MQRTEDNKFQTAGFGGSVRAVISDINPAVLWDPSQNGLSALWPQRQSETAVLPARSNAAPVTSVMIKSPSTLMLPLFLIVIRAGMGHHHPFLISLSI
jgi:hypothetical protein